MNVTVEGRRCLTCGFACRDGRCFLLLLLREARNRFFSDHVVQPLAQKEGVHVLKGIRITDCSLGLSTDLRRLNTLPFFFSSSSVLPSVFGTKAPCSAGKQEFSGLQPKESIGSGRPLYSPTWTGLDSRVLGRISAGVSETLC